MPIKISKTYEIVTHESAENGDVAESGFVFEDADYSFTELVYELERGGFTEPNRSHGCPDWVSTYPQQNYFDGSEKTYSLHPGKDKRSLRYWEKACRAVGLIK